MAELQFRDGPRDVPPHLAELMESLDLHKFTYAEAVDEANKKLMADALNKIQARVVTQHFKDQR